MLSRKDGIKERPRPDQALSDLDQTWSDLDQTEADRDATNSRADQEAADEDQAQADRVRAKSRRGPASRMSAEDEAADTKSRAARKATSADRLGNRVTRTETSHRRSKTSEQRDATSRERDEAADLLDVASNAKPNAHEPRSLAGQLRQVRDRAAVDRRRAAVDRDRAAADRSEAESEIAMLHAEIETAHLDDLTGAYRREMGELTLQHEIERARRGDGSFVIAFVDVDGMKQVNDRDGHAAGDHVLKTLVWTMRANLRPFDPVVRYGGDEFVAGLGGACLEEATERFDLVCQELCDEVHVGITVGLAELEPDETLEDLTARADALLLEAKANRVAQSCTSGDRS